MKIFDAFTFFNEYELLEIRLELLYKYVDHFIICESNLTHSGQEKPYNFLLEESRYKKYRDKIIYLQFEPDITDKTEFLKKVESYDPGSPQWKVETAQRDFMMSFLKEQSDNDFVFISDVDEIWNPKLGHVIRSGKLGIKAARVAMAYFQYWWNCRKVGKGATHFCWKHGFVSDISTLKLSQGLSALRVRGDMPIIYDVDGEWPGWHFSYMGGVQRIIEKIRAYAHQENNIELMNDKAYLSQCLAGGRNPFNQDNLWSELVFVPMNYFPQELRDLLENYPDWIKRTLDFQSEFLSTNQV